MHLGRNLSKAQILLRRASAALDLALPQNLWFALRAGFSAGAVSRVRCIPPIEVAQSIVVARVETPRG